MIMKTRVICSECKYEWATKSEMIWVTCPKCQRKTKNIAKKEGSKDV